MFVLRAQLLTFDGVDCERQTEHGANLGLDSRRQELHGTRRQHQHLCRTTVSDVTRFPGLTLYMYAFYVYNVTGKYVLVNAQTYIETTALKECVILSYRDTADSETSSLTTHALTCIMS